MNTKRTKQRSVLLTLMLLLLVLSTGAVVGQDGELTGRPLPKDGVSLCAYYNEQYDLPGFQEVYETEMITGGDIQCYQFYYDLSDLERLNTAEGREEFLSQMAEMKELELFPVFVLEQWYRSDEGTGIFRNIVNRMSQGEYDHLLENFRLLMMEVDMPSSVITLGHELFSAPFDTIPTDDENVFLIDGNGDGQPDNSAPCWYCETQRDHLATRAAMCHMADFFHDIPGTRLAVNFIFVPRGATATTVATLDFMPVECEDQFDMFGFSAMVHGPVTQTCYGSPWAETRSFPERVRESYQVLTARVDKPIFFNELGASSYDYDKAGYYSDFFTVTPVEFPNVEMASLVFTVDRTYNWVECPIIWSPTETPESTFALIEGMSQPYFQPLQYGYDIPWPTDQSASD